MKGHINSSWQPSPMTEEENMGTGQGHTPSSRHSTQTLPHLLSQYRGHVKDSKGFVLSPSPHQPHQRKQMNQINLPQHFHQIQSHYKGHVPLLDHWGVFYFNNSVLNKPLQKIQPSLLFIVSLMSTILHHILQKKSNSNNRVF